jgi:hypothetical protein
MHCTYIKIIDYFVLIELSCTESRNNSLIDNRFHWENITFIISRQIVITGIRVLCSSTLYFCHVGYKIQKDLLKHPRHTWRTDNQQ